MEKKFHNIAVLMGGGSSEREISLLSGAAVSGASKEAGYCVTPVEVSRDNRFALPAGTGNSKAVAPDVKVGFPSSGG